MMKKFIDITKAARQDIKKAFGVTEQMISYALNFDSKNGMSDTAARIRCYALQKGGTLMVVSKEVETIHDADGYMRQHFPNRMVIEVDKRTGNAALYSNGQLVVSFDNIKITELTTLQNIAAKWTLEDSAKMCDPAYKERFKRGVLLCWNRYDIVTHEEIRNV